MNWELVVAICAMLITIFVCIANIVSAYYAKQSHIEDNKAYIGFYFESYYINEFEKVIVFKNFGNSEGKILDINYNDDLPDYIIDFLKKIESRTIMPGQKISSWIHPDDHEILLKINYKYITLNKKFTYSIDLDLSESNNDLYTRVSKINSTTLPNELINVLKKIYFKL
ncbi:hypothetical protein NGB24_01935 [Mammaliicoccus vitulinus]|uniref:hypothetical protein n=1 Tax=Mammaliicoccus vitulinus TaxID=71237 RepID=UPI002DB7BA4E|nr:hypothetical protein [Mammaliicoccus vitulinus]MEB7656594.1 hypothetical protein [Mammaliicoccus vitulinus]